MYTLLLFVQKINTFYGLFSLAFRKIAFYCHKFTFEFYNYVLKYNYFPFCFHYIQVIILQKYMANVLFLAHVLLALKALNNWFIPVGGTFNMHIDSTQRTDCYPLGYL